MQDPLWQRPEISILSLMENYPLPFYLAQLNLMDSHDEVRIITAISGLAMEVR